MAAPTEAHVARKVPKTERMTSRQEMDAIKTMPRLSRLILVLKVAGVVLLAIGFEGLVTANWPLAITFFALGLFVSLMPIQVKINVCVRCGLKLDVGQAICPRCGVPNL